MCNNVRLVLVLGPQPGYLTVVDSLGIMRRRVVPVLHPDVSRTVIPGPEIDTGGERRLHLLP